VTKTEYAKYLQSPQWQARRKLAIEEAGSQCERCNLPRWLAELTYDQDLHVHHLTYANKGRERTEDLEVLCRRCHEIETFGRSELRSPKRATCESCKSIHWDYRSPYCAICSALFINGEMMDVVRLGENKLDGTPAWKELLDMISSLRHLADGPSVHDILIHTAQYCANRGATHPAEVMEAFKKSLAGIDFGKSYSDTDSEVF